MTFVLGVAEGVALLLLATAVLAAAFLIYWALKSALTSLWCRRRKSHERRLDAKQAATRALILELADALAIENTAAGKAREEMIASFIATGHVEE
ncbi:hypothetical protein [Microbacterium paludicola]|uniref:hypothetical protein n=1 Tax=Microbacterium paludicola TaxID=300019 RepID=UPI000B03C539|nr:hypothetical protein [Microbacterium paludicola]